MFVSLFKQLSNLTFHFVRLCVLFLFVLALNTHRQRYQVISLIYSFEKNYHNVIISLNRCTHSHLLTLRNQGKGGKHQIIAFASDNQHIRCSIIISVRIFWQMPLLHWWLRSSHIIGLFIKLVLRVFYHSFFRKYLKKNPGTILWKIVYCISF